MSATGLHMDREMFVCSICLELLKEPVTIPCGHSYCMSCVHTHFNEEAWRRSYSCPQCRHNFTVRPVLAKNTMLSVLMEGLKKSGPPVVPAEHIYAAHGDVGCDLCTERKLKAVKSCLQCLISYCKEHLQPHYDVPALKRHKLVEPTDNLQDNICSQHDEVMKMYCLTDQLCICYLCSVEQHKGHDLETIAAKRSQMQEELEDSKQKTCRQIEEKQKLLDALKKETDDLTRNGDKAVEASNRLFAQIQTMLVRRMGEVERQIESQQEHEQQQLKENQDQLQIAMTGLKRKHTELEKLAHTENNCDFLHNILSRDDHRDTSLDSAKKPQPPFFGRLVTESLTEIKNMHVPVPRDELLQYACDVTFNPRTAHSCFALSDENRKLTSAPKRKIRKTHPERFTHYRQILGKEPLTGRCYIEITIDFNYNRKIEQAFVVALTYKDIHRKGDSTECEFGGNANSWSLLCFRDNEYMFLHNKVFGNVYTEPKLSKIGVFLDYDEGHAAFYRLNEPQCMITETYATFTQPLYLGIGFVGKLNAIEICKLT